MRKLISKGAWAAAVSTVLALTALSYAPAPAGAAIQTRNGTLNANDSTMDVVFIDGINDTCGGQGATDVRYEVFPWTAPVAGNVEFRLTSTPNSVASFYIYDGPFDPANGTQNCLAADNSVDTPANEKTVTIPVQDEKTYRIVVIDDTFAQNGVSYQMNIEIPGGKATDPQTGPGKKYVKLPGSFSCGDLTATLNWKGNANRVKTAVIKANRRTVAQLPDRKISPFGSTVLENLPGNTNRLIATLKLKGGGKVEVKRFYTRC